MPTVNGIHIELQCQQTISSGGPIEEFAPRPRTSTDTPELFMPGLYDRKSRICSVFIPIFPRAQFFLRYQAEPSTQKNSLLSKDDVSSRGTSDKATDCFFVFQLFIGRDEVTTWSCGGQQSWHGKTCFAIYDTSSSEDSCSVKSSGKHIFMFNGDLRVTGDMKCDKAQDRKIEVRVFRANKAMRMPRKREAYEGQGVTDSVRTPFGGSVALHAPQKFYAFGLLDPLDQPYATFRWFYRSWDEIHAMGLRLGQIDTEEATAVFENWEFSKHPSNKTIHVTSRHEHRDSERPNVPHAIAKSSSQNPLRYDKSKGLVRLERNSRVLSTAQCASAHHGGSIPSCGWQGPGMTTDLSNAAARVIREDHSTPISRLANSSFSPGSQSKSKHGSHIPTRMLLPPQHPHARPLPKGRPLDTAIRISVDGNHVKKGGKARSAGVASTGGMPRLHQEVK